MIAKILLCLFTLAGTFYLGMLWERRMEKYKELETGSYK